MSTGVTRPICEQHPIYSPSGEEILFACVLFSLFVACELKVAG